MRSRVVVLAGLLALLPAMAAWAQFEPEVRPFAGVYVPIGDQRDVLKSATAVGASIGVETAEYFHVLGTFAFAGPNMKGWIGPDHMHIFQSDLGGEVFRKFATRSNWQVRPFIGLGAGVRTYDLTKSQGTESYFAGYGAIGSELQMSRVALRVEARDYVSRFRGLSGTADETTRNDLMITGGFAYHLW